MIRPSVVFFDRDGTLMEDARYIFDPKLVHLVPGAAAAVARLNRDNIPVIVVTNQSGLARGYFSLEDYEKVRTRFEQLLAAEGARVDATYICPHSAEDRCSCRKPRRELFERAIAMHDLDPKRLVFIGDRWRDVEAHLFFPGSKAGLIPSDMTQPEERERANGLKITYPDITTALSSIIS